MRASLRITAIIHLLTVTSQIPAAVLWLWCLSTQANCIDSTAVAEAVFASEVEKLKKEKIKPQEQITLEPYERDHAVVTGIYRSSAEIYFFDGFYNT